MKKILSFQQLFEWKTGEKYNKKWSEDENIIALYYYRADGDLSKLGIFNNEEFTNKYLGCSEDSLKMQSKCFQYIETKSGLEHYSKTQEVIYDKYKNYSERELRNIVLHIIENIPKEKIKQNSKIHKNIQQKLITKTNNKIKNKKRDNISFWLYDTSKMRDEPEYVRTDLEIPIKVGQILNHKKFGKGEVVKKEKSIIYIDFFEKDLGIKKILYNKNLFI